MSDYGAQLIAEAIKDLAEAMRELNRGFNHGGETWHGSLEKIGMEHATLAKNVGELVEQMSDIATNVESVVDRVLEQSETVADCSECAGCDLCDESETDAADAAARGA